MCAGWCLCYRFAWVRNARMKGSGDSTQTEIKPGMRSVAQAGSFPRHRVGCWSMALRRSGVAVDRRCELPGQHDHHVGRSVGNPLESLATNVGWTLAWM